MIYDEESDQVVTLNMIIHACREKIIEDRKE